MNKRTILNDGERQTFERAKKDGFLTAPDGVNNDLRPSRNTRKPIAQTTNIGLIWEPMRVTARSAKKRRRGRFWLKRKSGKTAAFEQVSIARRN